MAVADQKITDRYAVYNGDCIEVLPGMKDESIHISIYSPPFAELYNYSSSDRDLSNCASYEQFLEHYGFLVREISRVTMPGRVTCVHCMDLKAGNGAQRDFPGDIIRLHEKHGFLYHSRHAIWKEPLRVAIRTRALGLMHRQLVKDSSLCRAAGADFLLVFRKAGTNKVPVKHPVGLLHYAGERQPTPILVQKYAHWKNPKTNKLSHWIWQQYASSVWMDIRAGRVLPYKEAKEKPEEKHCCPLQLDVIERCLTLWSNAGETMLTPFMGVGSEVYCALKFGRRAVGIELKPSYYRQALKNIELAMNGADDGEDSLFKVGQSEQEDAEAISEEDAEEVMA